MLRNLGVLRSSAHIAAMAADHAFEAYLTGRAPYEPNVTDRILGAIENAMHNRRVGGVIWKSATFRSGSGRSADESRYGADFMGVLNVDLPNYQTSKGFLAQAKRAEPEQLFSSQRWSELIKQTTDMLNLTSESFVIVYSQAKGIRVFSATAVAKLTSRHIFDLYHKSLNRFLAEHFSCFVGDLRLSEPDPSRLARLAEEYDVPSVLYLKARSMW